MPYTTVNGIQLYYEMHGAGEPVALLNGIMQNTAGWSLQVPALAARYQVILHDMRGQGKSGKPEEEYSWDLHVEDFRQLLDYLEIEKIHLAGVSYGAETAMYFALKYPDRVKSLVLGTAASELTPLLKAFAQSWETAASCQDGYSFFKLFTPSVYGGSFLGSQQDWMEQRARLFEKTVTPDWFAGFLRLLQNFYTLNLTGQLKEIQAPTLVIAAEKDILKPVSLSALIHSQISGAEMAIIADAGHAAVLEKPAEFNSLLLGFLSKM